MADLFKKLNVLIKAGLNDILPEPPDPRRTDQPVRLGKDIDREVGALRQRVNEAIQYEEKLQAQARVLRDEVARWDQQADEAVARGNDAVARHAIDQMKRAEQRLTMAEADLREHQLVTEDLMRRVNGLEAVVADARRQQAQHPTPDAAPVQAIADVLRSAREKIAEMGDLLAARDEVNSQTTPPAVQAADAAASAAVDDDLARRRQRLSK